MEPKLNDALLAATEEDVTEVEQQPKRNTKDDLIGKIIACCADNGLELEHSNTKLRRMTRVGSSRRRSSRASNHRWPPRLGRNQTRPTA